MKRYKIWIGWKGMTSWLDCSIKYIECVRRPTEQEVLDWYYSIYPRDISGYFPDERYIHKIEEYIHVDPEFTYLDLSGN